MASKIGRTGTTAKGSTGKGFVGGGKDSGFVTTPMNSLSKKGPTGKNFKGGGKY